MNEVTTPELNCTKSLKRNFNVKILNSLTTTSDEERISPYNIQQTSNEKSDENNEEYQVGNY